MDFGAITTGVKAPIEEKLDRMKAWGMTAWHPASGEVADEDLARVKDLANERGLRICALSAGVPVSHPAKKEDNLAKWDKSVEIACGLDCKVVISRAFPKPDDVSDDDAWRSCIETCREMTKRCNDSGRIFAFETDHFNFIDDLEGTQRLLAEVGMPEMSINFDPCNYLFGGNEPMEVIDALLDRFVNGHIKDVVRLDDGSCKEAPVGEGQLDYEHIFGELHRRGFTGAMAIEHCGTYECIEGAWHHVQAVRAKVGV